MIKNDYELGKEWNILERLQWNFNKYLVYEFIYNNHGCVPKEISIETRVNLTTVYKYIDECHKANLIKKIYSKRMRKKGSRYVILPTIELKEVIEEYQRKVLDFSAKIKETTRNF